MLIPNFWCLACSEAARAIFRDYDSDMVAGSLDEAYLDVTDYCTAHGVTGTRHIVRSLADPVAIPLALTQDQPHRAWNRQN